LIIDFSCYRDARQITLLRGTSRTAAGGDDATPGAEGPRLHHQACGQGYLGCFRSEYTPTRHGFDCHFGYWNGYVDYSYYMNDQEVRMKCKPWQITCRQ